MTQQLQRGPDPGRLSVSGQVGEKHRCPSCVRSAAAAQGATSCAAHLSALLSDGDAETMKATTAAPVVIRCHRRWRSRPRPATPVPYSWAEARNARLALVHTRIDTDIDIPIAHSTHLQ